MKSSALTELLIASLNCQYVAKELGKQESYSSRRLDDAIKGIEKAIELIKEEKK